jgi:uncharacterized protein (DUF302 family)
MSTGLWKQTSASFADTITQVTTALQNEGFGIITRTDMQETLRNKLGVNPDPYLILGACNPALAWKALQFEPEIGLSLPCNVVIQQTPTGQIRVGIVDPLQTIARDNPELQPMAAEVREKMQRVLQMLPE